MAKNESGHGKEATKEPNASAVEAKIEAMATPYRAIGLRLHQIIHETAPELEPRLWYGMPGYAKSAGTPVLLFFRADETYMTFGLTEKVKFAKEEGAAHQLMPCAWFFQELDAPTESKIREIVRTAIR